MRRTTEPPSIGPKIAERGNRKAGPLWEGERFTGDPA